MSSNQDPLFPHNLIKESGPQELTDLENLYARLDLANLSYAIVQGGPVGDRAARLLGERLSALALSRDLLAELDAVRKRKQG